MPAIWDVPVLEPGWGPELARRSASAPVIAVLGFADRATVAEALGRGASACVESPWELVDLLRAVDRAIRPPHSVPPAPLGFRPDGEGRDPAKGRRSRRSGGR